ncbi:MAG: hypothetical protein ACI4TX_02630, partial [Christensenellales bacterium]
MISKIDKNLIKIYSAENTDERIVECIVYMHDIFDLKKLYDDIEIVREYPFIKAVGVRIRVKDMILLSCNAKVMYISSQNMVKAQIEESKKVLNIDRFYKEGIYGQGVRVAVIDTGIEPMLDFVIPKNRILLFKDFVNFFQISNFHKF